MDRLIVTAVNLMAPCSESLELSVTAASASQKAAKSAEMFQQDGDVYLAGARMIRSERLMRSLRETHEQFCKRISKVREAVDEATSLTATKKAAWNSLPDTWWLKRASRMSVLLAVIRSREMEMEEALNIGEEGNNELVLSATSYSDAVAAVAVIVNKLNQAWETFCGYVKEWRELAMAVHAGIGESGSLIPA